jgi:hypothetical protein
VPIQPAVQFGHVIKLQAPTSERSRQVADTMTILLRQFQVPAQALQPESDGSAYVLTHDDATRYQRQAQPHQDELLLNGQGVPAEADAEASRRLQLEACLVPDPLVLTVGPERLTQLTQGFMTSLLNALERLTNGSVATR